MNKAHRLSKANYLPRVVGFVASFIMIAFLVVERDWSYWNFLVLGFYFLIYPHLVYLGSRFADDGKKVELYSMMFDALVLGMWTAHIHFTLWISYAFLTATVLNNMMLGGFKQLFKSLALYGFGILILGAVTGFQFEPSASLYVELIAMISLVLYVASIAWTFYNVNERLAMVKMQVESKNTELENTLRELDETRKELVEVARKSGMADIATGVLHNIGNVLNSIVTSASITGELLEKTKLKKLFQAIQLLKEHEDDLEHFLTADPKGEKLIEYFFKLDEVIKEELKVLRKHHQRLDQKIAAINEIIEAQQNYAMVGMKNELASLEGVLEDALTIFSASMERHKIEVEKDIKMTDTVSFQKVKLVHILLNLFKNSKEAIDESRSKERKIFIKLYQQNGQVFLEVSDTGPGIKKEHLGKIFNQGFTTKKKGHGFGLHSCANYMEEMGGTIEAKNREGGIGTKFILSLPVTVDTDNTMGIEKSTETS
ncbi:MAG: GHKL domain-containing protein [Gracilimonas sp.]|uniref:ATP-binding protein n=1 Tax=Gracilimonas sp. TaxID=1974203 RepID=UPI0019A89AAD|nr:ATP-binding protein [Gracilimonas sp.]MBD3616082.1 GHKL domain-containing protein [Gracilimonas sp.]